MLIGEISPGRLGQFVLYAAFAAAGLGQLSEVWGEVSAASGAAERLFEILRVKPEIAAPAAPRALPSPARGDVAFSNVSFAYPARPTVPVVDNVSFSVRAGEKVETEAIVKIKVGDERYVEVAEGNGPVNALDKALRQAITRHYPELKKIELTGYRVRILDTAHGTGAGTRVLLDSKHEEGGDSWGSIGVSPNIIEASWEALVDSLAYAFQNGSGSDGD